VDFELAAMEVLKEIFWNVSIKCYRFHLGQVCMVGTNTESHSLIQEYKRSKSAKKKPTSTSNEIGKSVVFWNTYQECLGFQKCQAFLRRRKTFERNKTDLILSTKWCFSIESLLNMHIIYNNLRFFSSFHKNKFC
jgi:hypothetical protein